MIRKRSKAIHVSCTFSGRDVGCLRTFRVRCGGLAVLIWLALTPVTFAQGLTEAPAPESALSASQASEHQGAAGPEMKLSPEDVGPRWVATAEALFLQRSTAGSQQLLYDPGASAGLLSASNLDFSLNAGPRLTLRRDGPAGMGLELIYFGIDGWQSSADFPNSAFTYGVGNLAIDKTMTVPVSDARFQDTSRIYSGEINLRVCMERLAHSLGGPALGRVRGPLRGQRHGLSVFRSLYRRGPRP